MNIMNIYGEITTSISLSLSLHFINLSNEVLPHRLSIGQYTQHTTTLIDRRISSQLSAAGGPSQAPPLAAN